MPKGKKLRAAKPKNAVRSIVLITPERVEYNGYASFQAMMIDVDLHGVNFFTDMQFSRFREKAEKEHHGYGAARAEKNGYQFEFSYVMTKANVLERKKKRDDSSKHEQSGD